MLLVATTWPLEGGATIVEALEREARLAEEGKTVEPESWLALGALLMLILASLATPSVECWKTGAVLVLSRGACDAITTYSMNVTCDVLFQRGGLGWSDCPGPGTARSAGQGFERKTAADVGLERRIGRWLR